MDELVKYIAEQLVEYKDELDVQAVEKNNEVVIEVRVKDSDMGKIIGKKGRIAKDIRTIVKAATANAPKKYIVEIIE